MTGTLSGSLALLLLSCVLSGCAAPEAPTPQGPPTPALSQEQRDDEAFRDLLTGFLDLPFQGEAADDLHPFLTGTAYEDEMREVDRYQAAQQEVVGKDTYSGFSVTARGKDFMVAQACLDVSGTRIIDADGRDVTPSRSSTVSLQLKAVRGDDGAWAISDMVPNDAVLACG
ncbi:hypothetical protein [Clavibacter michiganensis]|uniref:hypothetical protein n=1 Tax=Clavibacter michiganensis TaxID=28447 RepID=UPI0021583D4E|nr:hypothetical protein [Clavibacter michiganensis]